MRVSAGDLELLGSLSDLRVRCAIKQLPRTASYPDVCHAIEMALGLESPTAIRFRLLGLHRHDGRTDVFPLVEAPFSNPDFESLLQEMASDKELLLLFVDWLLADEGRRPKQEAKNPTVQIRGYWVAYGWTPQPSRRGKNGIRRGRDRMKGSDLPERRYVAIRALRKIGMRRKAACDHVAKLVCGDRPWYALSESINTSSKRYKPWRDLCYWIRIFGTWLTLEIRHLFLPLILHREIYAGAHEVLFKLAQSRALEAFGSKRRAVRFVKTYKGLIKRAVKVVARIDRNWRS